MTKKFTRLAALAGAFALAGGVQAGVQLATATPAAAVTGLVKTQSVSSLSPGTAKTETAECPAGKQVVGGGGWADDGGADAVRLISLQPMKTSSGSRYAVTAEAGGFTGNWRLTAYALCADPVAGHEIVSASTGYSSATFQQTAAACPSGKKVIGTGAHVGYAYGQVGLTVNRASGPLDIARAAAREDADGHTGNWNLKSWAICVNPLPGMTSAGTVSSGDGGNATCPAGTQVHSVGGGGSLSDSGPYFLQVLYPFDNLNGFQVYLTGTPTGGTSIGAVCANP